MKELFRAMSGQVEFQAEPDLSATLLANLKAYVAGGVIEASGSV